MLVDSGSSGHYFDDNNIPELRYKLANNQVLDEPCKTVTAGGYQLYGVERGLLRGSIVNVDGAQRLVQLSCLFVPSLGHNLLLLK